MNVLADVNIESALVGWLRSQKHDVVWATETLPSAPDSDLLDMANEQQRILLTYDRDFGELVFLRKLVAHGIILLRFDAALQTERLALLQRHWPSIEEQAPHHFLVVLDQKVRMRPLP